MLSLADVAKYLDLAEATIYQWAQKEKLPAYKLGGIWRFKQGEIDAWLETQRSGPDISTQNPLID